jgi:ubiquinone/menaquinone biosynthesis C-methylase UbiE
MSTTVPDVVIPEEVVSAARRTIGAYFKPISKADPEANIQDFLDISKSVKRAEILERYTPLRGKKLLEIGSGFGTNLVVWIKHFNVDGYGIEPESTGFNEGFIGSVALLSANGIDLDRIRHATGEAIPFPDETFDIVYSANVLEHTDNPEKVLRESFRVLKKGGVLHMEMPNFLSYFEGHYLVFQPPIFWKPILPWLVRYVYRRDPAFARTLRTQINPVWCQRTVRAIAPASRLEVLSLGEDIFLERLAQAFQFEMRTTATRLQRVIGALQALNFRNWIGRLIVALKGHYPIYLTVRKSAE